MNSRTGKGGGNEEISGDERKHVTVGGENYLTFID